MARPKKDSDSISASQRIENAYWSILECGSYSDITIANLARQAKVNHNTIYYYYNNIDDMAIKLFNKNIPLEIPRALLSFATTGDDNLTPLLSDQQLMKRWLRARLYTRGDSAFLMNCYKKAIIDTWFSTADIKHENLTDEDRIVLEFIFSGLVALIGNPLVEKNPGLLLSLLRLNLGKEIFSALTQITKSTKQKEAFCSRTNSQSDK
jgi:AcrR family transcriptional regulator